jgi:hypothetical protein
MGDTISTSHPTFRVLIMVKRKSYGLETEKLAGNKPRGSMPLVLDDRLISKQYITQRVDSKVDNTPFGVTWNEVTDVAPSKEVLYEYLNSLTTYSDMWTKEEDTTDTNIRAIKTGNYGLGKTNFTGADTWAKFDVEGSISATGNYIMATNGSTIGPTSGALTLHSTNGALLPTKFMIGTGTADVPLEVSLAGSTATAADGTGIIQAGADSGANLGIGVNKIQARSAEAVAELLLNTTGGDVTLGGASSTVTVAGDLVVSGAATTLNVDTFSVEDNEIILNSNVTGATPLAAGAKVTVERGDAANAQILWDESDDRWSVHNGTSEFHIDHSTHAPITLSATNTAAGLTLSGQEIGLADKFVQLAGDTMTGPLQIGSSNSNITNLRVYGGVSGETNPAIYCEGDIAGNTKSFNLEHPTKKGMRLIHGCLEGPEYGMYQRGTLKSNSIIEEISLPEYWKAMVGDYTVLLTPRGNYNVWLEEKNKTMFKIKTSADAIDGPWKCEWLAIGRRLDAKLEVEINAKE